MSHHKEHAEPIADLRPGLNTIQSYARAISRQMKEEAHSISIQRNKLLDLLTEAGLVNSPENAAILEDLRHLIVKEGELSKKMEVMADRIDAIAHFWQGFYGKACHSFHMRFETEEEMDERLNDFGVSIHDALSSK